METAKSLAQSPRPGAGNSQGPACVDCGRPLNPVAVMMGPVCGLCVRKRHAAAIGKGA